MKTDPQDAQEIWVVGEKCVNGQMGCTVYKRTYEYNERMKIIYTINLYFMLNRGVA